MEPPMKTTTEHLVLSGGAVVGFAFFGVLQTLLAGKIIDLDNIKTIHATSAGTLVAVAITLGYELDVVKTYLIDRPWKDVYKMDLNAVFNAVKEGGMFGRTEIFKTMEPLLLGKDLSMDITLEEFYAFNKKEIHFYTTFYSTLELVDLSYKTHPTWKLVDAMFASSCLPVLFIPFLHEGDYYIDGAIVMNYPLKCCMDGGHDPATILGIFYDKKVFKMGYNQMKASPFTSPSSPYKLLDLIMSLSMKFWISKRHEGTEAEKNVPNQISVVCSSDPVSIFNAFDSKDERLRLYHIGKDAALKYTASLTQPQPPK